jgi:hypothetical protein
VFLQGRHSNENWLITNYNQHKHVITPVKIGDEKSKVTIIRWHPTVAGMALALIQKPNTNGHDLYLSRDGGKSWGSGPVRTLIVDAQFGSPDATNYDGNKLYGIRVYEGTRYFFEFDINQLSSSDAMVENAFEFFHMKQYLFVATVCFPILSTNIKLERSRYKRSRIIRQY